jgi:exodeoxyribonuclease VII small subunit
MNTSADDDRSPDTPGYSALLGELEEILDDLEDDNIDIDRLAERVERASVLIRLCRERIAAARTQVDRIVADLESIGSNDDQGTLL